MFGFIVVSCILCSALIPIFLAIQFFNWLLRAQCKARQKHLQKKRKRLEKKIQKIDKEMLDISATMCYT